MPAPPSLSRRLLRKLGIDRIRKIVDHYGYTRTRSIEPMIDEIVRKTGRDLSTLVSASGPFNLDQWNDIASSLGGRPRRSFEALCAEFEFCLDPVLQEFDADERIKDLRENPGATYRLAQLLGMAPADLTERLRDTHGRTLLGNLLPELRQLRSAVAADSDEEEEDGTSSSIERDDPTDTPTLLTQLLQTWFAPSQLGTAWPAQGILTVQDRRYEVSIYARVIGSGSRGNALERRFQNPSQRQPIVDDPNRYEMLLGLWVEQGDERAVVVAFDALRRAGRTTRFSLFMPLSLLEQAADTGFATHETGSGEVLYAFRPENLGRYIEAAYEAGSWVLEAAQASAQDTRPPASTRIETAASANNQLSIRPQVGMYSAFARLNYKPWFALAEFVDNSIQSFLHHREALVRSGHEGPLVIDLNIDDNELTITDRAGGIAWADFPRAFSPATPPADATGLSEFGLGMKAAACWFSRRWTVRTSALNENVERSVVFDIPNITSSGSDVLPIESRPARDSDHYTVIAMTDLRVRPKGRTLGKIKDHLASIYRTLIADGTVRIRLTTNGKTDELAFVHPELLHAPHYRARGSQPVLWRKTFEVDLHDRRVTGWAGIMSRGSHSSAGFSVFRRRRLIEGSVGETYKPHAIFGNPNSFISQRVVGEMHVEGFDVTHTKDGIQWHGYEDEVLDLVRRQLDSNDLPLLDQAEGYRARKVAENLPVGFGTDALSDTATAFAHTATLQALQKQVETPLPSDVPGADIVHSAESIIQKREFRLQVVRSGTPWRIHLELVRDSVAPFYTTSVELSTGDDHEEVITVQINLSHPFSIAYINDNESSLQPIVRLIAALALGERIARQSGARVAPLRQLANEILKGFGSEEGF